jgi:hypothetical protein
MAEAHKRAYRHPKYKTSYRVKNWSEYEQSLRNRGDITVWLSGDAIETSLTLRLVFHLPLRQAEGFLKSILKLMDLYLPCPDHTTVSRRNQTVNVCRCTGSLPDGPVHFKDAVLSNNSISVPSYRDRHVDEIRSKGWTEWKRQSGYYLQSHAENAFYRYKRIIGGRLRSKNDDAQKREAEIGCTILNRMLEMGEPLSYAVG